MKNAHEITRMLEEEICNYTKAPFSVCTDNASNAIFLCLKYYLDILGKREEANTITIPANTYPAVPMEILHNNSKIKFEKGEGDTLTGMYRLKPTPVYDSALLFTKDMYVPGTYLCLSFTGPFKTFSLGKGGCILLDDEIAYNWLKKARFSGRSECSYFEDDFDNNPVVGYNFYMPIETAARGLHMFPRLYDPEGNPKSNEPLTLKYPDLSRFKIFKT